jgi:methionyl-tRNA formyltransferase
MSTQMMTNSHNGTPRVVWCGYRGWSDRLLELARADGSAEIVACFSDPRVFADFMSTTPEIDIIVLAGWSWKIPEALVKRYPCIGLHPSDLPKYRGGSPLQHQIIDGLTETQCSLFMLSQEFDEGPVLAKAPMSLAGNMNDIFNELIRVGAELLNRSFLDWPNWHPEKQDNTAGFVRKRRKPEESHLESNMFQTHSLQDLYNIIRALGDPYPNAYIEDEKGNRMMFKEVAFISGNPGTLSEKGK